jgi:hypothetical protein
VESPKTGMAGGCGELREAERKKEKRGENKEEQVI